MEGGRRIHECPQGRFHLPAALDSDGLLDADATVAELDLLLTGGRMTGVSRRQVREALLGPVGLESKLAAAEKVAMRRLGPKHSSGGPVWDWVRGRVNKGRGNKGRGNRKI